MRIGDLLTALFILGCAVFAAVQAIGWPPRTQVFPLAISLPLIGLLGTHLVLVLLAVRKPRRRGVAVIAGTTEGHQSWLPDRRRGIAFGGWLGAYVIAIWLVGFLVAGPALTLLFLRYFGRESWWVSGSFTVGVWMFLAVMAWVLRLPLPQGVIDLPFQ